VKTNIPEDKVDSFTYNHLELSYYLNDEIYQIFQGDAVIKSIDQSFDGNDLLLTYTLNLNKDSIQLDKDGFFEASISFVDTMATSEELNFSVAYRDDIEYISYAKDVIEGEFIYKAYFLNRDESLLVPFYFSVTYPESITVEARNRLYTPPVDLGLSEKQAIPNKTSVSKIGNKHYGIFMYTKEFSDVIVDEQSAQLAVDAIVRTLIRLPHIDKISLFIDDAQVEGSFYDIDLTKIYEAPIQSFAYLTEDNGTNKRYLVPVPIQDENIYDEVWTIFNTLKTGQVEDTKWTQIVPPEVVLQNFLIEGTTLTLDFNSEFINAYDALPTYKELMLNSILYSFTSINNITKVAFTIDGEPLTSYADMDLTEPVLAPAFINYLN
jgi:spore germination protein GerM